MKNISTKIIALLLILSIICPILMACSNNSDLQSPTLPPEGEETTTQNPSKNTDESKPSDNPAVPEKEFVPILRFVVASDTHVTGKTDFRAERLEKLLTSAYNYADTHRTYDSLDAVILVGDITAYGTSGEYQAVKEILEKNTISNTKILTVMGNHDHDNSGQANYLSVMDTDLNVHETINGFHFIGISTSQYDTWNYTNEAVQWMGDAVEAAAAENSKKPIFTFQHIPLQNTVYESDIWYTINSDAIKSYFNKYPQIVNFSGHTHGPINNPTSLWQGEFTALATGTLNYIEMGTKMTYGTIPPNSSNVAQYHIIEVDADNTVRIMPYNILTNDFFRTASNTDDESEQLIYTIENPSDKSGFLYASRAETCKAPYFDNNAAQQATVTDITSKNAVLTFPQAFDEYAVYGYDITYGTAGSSQKVSYFSEFYFEPMPETLKFTLSGLKANSEYSVQITPINCFGKRGEPLTIKFNSAEAEVKEYTSENPVNYVGTFSNFDSTTSLSASNDSYVHGGSISGDIFVGTWDNNNKYANAKYGIEAGKGYDASNALALWSTDAESRAFYLFATEQNKNSTLYPHTSYLRLWVDFSDVNFRKACFGLISPTGGLYSTDEGDGLTNQKFWYCAEGSSEWKQYTHGGDGCFGMQEGTNVSGFRGWLAFPIGDFLYRSGTGTVEETAGISYPDNYVSGIYMFWDYYSDSHINKKFYIDEIHIVEDYRVFDKYTAK